jgi:uroporphyrinogen decarboxylase
MQTGLMMRKETWREWFGPRLRRVIGVAKDANPDVLIWYHSDGNITDIIAEMIDAGLDILNPVQPECVDTDDLYRRYGRRLTFDGTIGTQSTMPFGTADEVRRRVREVIDKYGRNGGLIVSPTHVLEPEVPLANIDALFAACREYGTFE